MSVLGRVIKQQVQTTLRWLPRPVQARLFSAAKTIQDSVPAANKPKPHRVFNFSAGPAAMPTEVMMQAQEEFLDWHGLGLGIMEMSHRDVKGPVQNSIETATNNIRQLLKVPDNYDIIWMQGGAHAQFAAVPLNLLGDKKDAVYLNSGYWSTRAIDEAKKYCKVHIAFDCTSLQHRTIPPPSEWNIPSTAAYVHICANETIHGLEFTSDPDYDGKIPLIGDFTSTLLSRPVNISKYGVIYASGGKNLGPAGTTVVIARKDLVNIGARPETPSVLDWKKFATTAPIPSLYNTPPTFLIYMAGLVLANLAAKGGVEAMKKRAIAHSSRIYGIIDESRGFYSNHVDPKFRSRMNVPFRVGRGADGKGGDKALEDKFTAEAGQVGLLQVFGHYLFGGQRITLYNGVPDEAVNAIAEFMVDFQRKYDRS